MFLGILFKGYTQDASEENKEERQMTLEEIKNTFTNVINEMEAQKVQRAEQREAELRMKLNGVLEEWIESERQNRESELNKLLHNNWENILMLISPMPYDYYLRNYEYQVVDYDIIEKDYSMDYYRASAEINEQLSIERYHADAVSSIEPYLHTVNTKIKIKLSYEGERFIVKDITRGQSSIVQGWHRE